MGILESLPVQRIRPVLALPFWLGTLRDVSGNGNHVASTTAPINWDNSNSRDGITSPSTGYLQIAADPSLMVTDLTIFVITSVQSQKTNEYTIRNNGGIYFYRSATNMLFYDGVAASAIACDTVGANTLAVTATADTARPVFYCDGVSPGVASIDSTPTPNADYWRILGFAGNNGHQSPCHGIFVWPGVLTTAEVLSLHNWAISRFTPRKQWPGGGLDIPTRVGHISEPMFIANIQTARVTLANVTSGWLSNTGWRVNSGTWAVTEDAAGRYLTCVAAGQIQYELLGAAGYTVSVFGETGTATLTQNANNLQIDAGNGDTIWAVELVP